MASGQEVAARLLHAGRWAELEVVCSRALAGGAVHPPLLQMLGIAKRHLGKLAEAERLLRQSVVLAPRNPEYRTNLAQLLGAMDKGEEAIREFEHALALDPAFRTARLGLARFANRTRRHDLGERHARLLLQENAQDADAWLALGAALYGKAAVAEAARAFERAVHLAPDNGAARYQLATALCEQERAEEALVQAGEARRRGVEHRGLVMTRARALVHLDRYAEAIDELDALLARDDHDVEAHFLLAQIRHVRGEPDFARRLRAAASRPGASIDVRAAYADVLRRAGDLPSAEAILRALLEQSGGRPELLSSLATILQDQSRWQEAFEFASRAHALLPHDVTIAENFVAIALSLGETAAALPVIELFGARTPRDQRWITYRIDLARQRHEPLYEEWSALDRFVQTFDLRAPAGFGSAEEFNQALREVLEARHLHAREPLDQSLRAGTQTSRGLLGDADPIVRAFLASLREPLAEYQSRLGHAADHPFLRHNSGDARLAGCWSVRLRRGGFHVNHIHPAGWISSAYYVSVPPEVEDGGARRGWLKFGEPRFPMPGCTPVRFVQPRPGRLVLFPSYAWHGTTPLTSDDARLTIAFDAVPASWRA